MKNQQPRSYKWAYLPFVFSSAAILATSATAGPGASQQYNDARQVNSVNHEYVGGRTQAGISVTDEGDLGVELNHVFSESNNSSTSGGLWADYDLDEKEVLGRGVQLNHNWVSRDNAGRASHINKVTAAYDRNASGHDKATLGYGQENESLFWEGHVSKGLSGKKNSRKVGSKTVSDKAYDYGVGASVGTFLKGANVRVRAGLDHEWGDDVGAGEKDAKNTTLSAGIEKFFQGTPHSLGLDVAASKRSGGYKNGSDDTDVNGRLSYRYDFGGASIYQPDRRYKRVRVEIPGRATAPRYAQKPSYKRVPTYKTVPTYSKKTIRKPYKQLVKSTMALEGQTFFKLNSSKLIPSAQTRLKQIATEIRRNGYKGSIRITGNTCGLGDPVYDQRLSEKRANAVKAFLIRNGFDANRLVARGLGKGHPKFPNTPAQGFKNRRVDIEYVTERSVTKTGYRTETRNVRTGSRRVATGFKNVPTGNKNVLITSGKPGAPRVIWRTEVIPTSPAWIKRALHNNIKHDRNVSTYQTTAGSTPAPVNVAPIAADDTKTVSCSTAPITIDAILNDSDRDGDALTITKVEDGQFGTTKIVGNKIVYTPNGTGCGQTDSFEYTISDGNGHTTTATVNVKVKAPANVAPIAVDDSATTMQGQSVTLTTLSNDTDADGDTLTITNVEDPANGTATISGGEIIYTPDSGFVGTDTFEYTISDGNGHTVTATETVIVTAAPVTPTPVNQAPIAVNDTRTVSCSTNPIVINVINNDSDVDGDALTVIDTSNGQYGTTTVVGNQVVYTPNGSGCGKTDIFKYSIADGQGHKATATVTVNMDDDATPINVAPVAVDDSTTTEQGVMVALNTLSNDTDADGDVLTITYVENPANGTAEIVGGQIVYTPNADFVGTETFEYTISDGNGHTSTATETVIVRAAPTQVNVAPVAVDNMATAFCETITIKVLDNDYDADGDTLTITDLSEANLGIATIQGNTVVYQPVNECGTGIETLSYTISDGNGHTATANIKIDVKGDGGCTTDCGTDPINVTNDSANTKEGKGVTIDVLANDDSGLTITEVNSSNNGYVEIMNGKLAYMPKDGFSGKDTFSYTVKDAHGQTAKAYVTVMVEKDVVVPGPNVAPVAREDAPTTAKDKAITIDVLANDTDADGDELTITSVTQPQGASVEIINNKIRFTPQGVVGSISFSYTISDGQGHSAQTSVTVATTDPDSGNIHYPLITGESITIKKNEIVIIDVLANDSDADGDTLILDQVSSGSKGSTYKDNGKVRYEPSLNATGTDEFYYGVHDGHGHNGSGKVTITITD